MARTPRVGSKGKRCIGVCKTKHTSKAQCVGGVRGSAKVLKRDCQLCYEQRCRDHCECARKGKAKGRAAGRGNAQPTVTAAPASVLAPAVLKPVGRASSFSGELFVDTSLWYHAVCTAISTATQVELASFMYQVSFSHWNIQLMK